MDVQYPLSSTVRVFMQLLTCNSRFTLSRMQIWNLRANTSGRTEQVSKNKGSTRSQYSEPDFLVRPVLSPNDRSHIDLVLKTCSSYKEALHASHLVSSKMQKTHDSHSNLPRLVLSFIEV